MTLKRIIFFIFLISFPASFSLAANYDLEIKEQDVFITGKAVKALTINNQIPGPTLYFKEGEDAVINVKNSLNEKTSIHWHGILLPGNMDGVPGLNGFEGIAPGQTFTYKFKIRQAGTYWYHSHSNLQEQQGLYGAIVIEPNRSLYLEGKSSRCEAQPSSCAAMGVHKDYVIVLSDFTEENPNRILNNLKIDSGYYNYRKRTVMTFFEDAKKNGFSATLQDYLSWGEMRMDPTDLSDVSKYHFLINGKTAEQNWSAIFKKNERVKLRFINAAAMTIFDVSIPGLKMKFVEADGQPIKPVIGDEFRIAPAETYDVIIEPAEEKAYTIFAESLDRLGYALGTIAPPSPHSASLRDDSLPLNRGNITKPLSPIEIPKMRPRTMLTMADMMMEGMDMSEMKSGWADAGTPFGHKALQYSDLVSLLPQKDLRQPTREIELRFGGSMNRYIWTINGEQFPAPIKLKFGERVRLKFVNETMMAHPVHLHGMFMQLENGHEMKWLPSKHTIILPPAQSATALLTADEEGEWAFHCHLLYHMASGMMSNVVVEKKLHE